MAKLEISKIERRQVAGDVDRLQAQFSNETFFYEFPTAKMREDAIGDVLLLSTLAVAMLRASSLVIPDEYAISSSLHENLDRIQRILHLWNSEFKKVEVEAAIRTESISAGEGVGLFYAGGIDSSFELLTSRELVDELVCVYGFDFQTSSDEVEESLSRLGAVARHYGKRFAPVSTNHSIFLRRSGVSRLLGHGMTLAAIGLSLGLRECHIASSYTVYELQPWGSHPLLDPLFSNDVTQIIHGDNTIARFEKTKRVSTDPFLLENLRVCWFSHGDNCGRCSKCLRTMAALRMLGTPGPFPKVRSLSDYRKFASSTDVCWVTELVNAAREVGDSDLERQLKRGLRLHDLRVAAKYLIQAIFGRRLQRLINRFRNEREPAKWDQRPDLK